MLEQLPLLLSFDMIFYLSVDWSNFFRRHLIKELARQLDGRGKVLCIQRPVDPLVAPIRNRHKLWQWVSGFLSGGAHPLRLDDNLYLATPFVALHDQLATRVPGAVWLNRELLSFQMGCLTRSLGLRPERLVSWLFKPHQADYIGVAREQHLIYECYDEYLDSANHRRPSSLKRMQEREIRILKRADLVFATSQSLADRRAAINPKTYLAPNGVDYDHFSMASGQTSDVPADISNIKHPVIGFVGTMNESIDFPLLARTAECRPDWSFVLVGPFYSCRPGFTRSLEVVKARSCENIRFLGPRHYDEIPGYLKAFDVCLVPYKDNEYNRNRSPIKLYEYLAAGKPVVATASAQARLFGAYVATPKGPDEFIASIERMLRCDQIAFAKEAKTMAQDNSWRARANTILKLLQRELAE